MLGVIEDTLNVYPEVKGIQIMNDMGDYMFASYRGQWIPDTPRYVAILLFPRCGLGTPLAIVAL